MVSQNLWFIRTFRGASQYRRGVGVGWHHSIVPTHHVIKPADRPMAEVMVGGEWRPAEIRMWTQEEDGTWTANVSWSSGPHENRLDNFPAELLRPVDASTS